MVSAVTNTPDKARSALLDKIMGVAFIIVRSDMEKWKMKTDGSYDLAAFDKVVKEEKENYQ